MTTAKAHAKINLSLVVGPRLPSGKHRLATVYQRLDLADTITLRPAERLAVAGFDGDTLVTGALRALAAAAGVEAAWQVRVEKAIPVAAGLGGGSSDAAAALLLANETLPEPLPPELLRRIAARIGADVPFFLEPGTQLGTGDGTDTEPIELPLDYTVCLLAPDGESKVSSGSVYAAFDARGGEAGFDDRYQALMSSLASVRRATDLAALPANDLAASPHAAELERLGAFRADVSGGGPVLYGLFEDEAAARAAADALAPVGRTWICKPTW